MQIDKRQILSAPEEIAYGSRPFRRAPICIEALALWMNSARSARLKEIRRESFCGTPL
jgi:hypothetical protein